MVEITQADRKAAAAFILTMYGNRLAGDMERRKAVSAGKRDFDRFVQAFAAHRLAERERCARVAESYSFWQGSSNLACPHTRGWIAAAIRSDENTR